MSIQPHHAPGVAVPVETKAGNGRLEATAVFAPDPIRLEPGGAAPDGGVDWTQGVTFEAMELKSNPLLVLRAARLAAEADMEVAPETLAQMDALRDELAALPRDQVRAELEKGLMAKAPSRFFGALEQAHCLFVWFPEVQALRGVDHSNPDPAKNAHPEGDAWNHTMMVLDWARTHGVGTEGMYAALGHDFGKPLVSRAIWPRMFGHAELAAAPVKAFADRLGLEAPVAQSVQDVAALHHRVHEAVRAKAGTMVDLIRSMRQSGLGVAGTLLVCEADFKGRGGAKLNGPYPPRALLEACDRAMTEADLSGIVDLTDKKEYMALIKAIKPVIKAQREPQP